MKGARLLNLRHPQLRFNLYLTLASLVRCYLNITLGCHRFYYIAPLPVLDPIYPVVNRGLKYCTGDAMNIS